jgi:hypothetical protein
MKSLKKAHNLFYPGSGLDFRPIIFFIENTEIETFYYCDYEIFQNNSIEFIQDEISRQICSAIDNENESEIQEQQQVEHIDDFWDFEIDWDSDETESQDEVHQAPNNNSVIRDFNEYSVRYIGIVNPEIYGKLNLSEFFHENSNINENQIDTARIHKFKIYNNYNYIELIYFATEAIKTYEILLNKLHSIDVVLINQINLDQHWQTFGHGSLLKQLANSSNKPPKHILIGNDTIEWKQYQRLNNNFSRLVWEKLNFKVFYYNGAILLRELLRLTNVNRIKFHFIDKDLENNNAINLIKEGSIQKLIALNYRNTTKSKIYSPGEVSIGLVRVYPGKNLWLLFHVGIVKEDLNVYNGVGYNFKEIIKFDKYINRLIVSYPIRRQSKIRKAEEIFDDFEVTHILPITFDRINQNLI